MRKNVWFRVEGILMAWSLKRTGSATLLFLGGVFELNPYRVWGLDQHFPPMMESVSVTKSEAGLKPGTVAIPWFFYFCPGSIFWCLNYYIIWPYLWLFSFLFLFTIIVHTSLSLYQYLFMSISKSLSVLLYLTFRFSLSPLSIPIC